MIILFTWCHWYLLLTWRRYGGYWDAYSQLVVYWWIMVRQNELIETWWHDVVIQQSVYAVILLSFLISKNMHPQRPLLWFFHDSISPKSMDKNGFQNGYIWFALRYKASSKHKQLNNVGILNSPKMDGLILVPRISAFCPRDAVPSFVLPNSTADAKGQWPGVVRNLQRLKMFNLRVQRLLLQTRRLETGASSKLCYDMFYGFSGFGASLSTNPCTRT